MTKNPPMGYDPAWVAPPEPNDPPRKINLARHAEDMPFKRRLIKYDDPMMDDANAPIPGVVYDDEGLISG